MMSGTSGKINPRPEFMSSLKSLCRNLDSEVRNLELETRAALHHKVGLALH